MTKTPQFPVNLNLEGRSALVVGAGRIALRKAEQLLATGAVVTVVAPQFISAFDDVEVRRVVRGFEISDLEGQRVVITATGVREVDQLIYDECERRGIWVNSADDPSRCSFTLPAVIRRGDLQIAISTGGSSPAFSSYLRRWLEDVLDATGNDISSVVSDLAGERDRIHAEGTSSESVDWAPIIERVLESHGVRLLQLPAVFR